MSTLKTIQRFLWTVTGAVALTWVACYPPNFESIYQPDAAANNSSFTAEIVVSHYDYSDDADRIVSAIGMQLPAGIKEHLAGREVTEYKLVFGIQLPIGWTVNNMIPFTGVDEGVFAYSDSLSSVVSQNHYPPDPLYYWWVAETVDFMDTSAGAIYFNPVVLTNHNPGNFSLDYLLGHWDGYNGYYEFYDAYSADHMITVGLPDTVYVTSSANSGPGSLREAIDSVSAGGTILFDLPIPAAILLTQPLEIYKGVNIIGPPSGNVALSGGNACRVIVIRENKLVNLSNLQVVNGNNAGGYGGGIFCGTNSRGTMTNLRVENNVAARGGGIYLPGGQGNWTFKGMTVRNNTASDLGGGIYGTGNIIFNPSSRCNIYCNQAPIGADLYGGHSDVIRLKKFTVIQPNEYFVYPPESFSGFDIQIPVLTQLDQDVYVSPTGSDANSGTSPASPFKTITQALKMTISNPQSPNTIHLAAGTYSAETNGELYPLYANSHVWISGESSGTTILQTTGNILQAAGDVDVSLNGLGLIRNSTNNYGYALDLSDADVNISGFCLGFEDGAGYGSTIRCRSSSLTLSDGTISNINSGSSIIYAYYGSVVQLDQVEFMHNNITLLEIRQSESTLNQCQVYDNTLTSGYTTLIYLNSGSQLDMDQCQVYDNTLTSSNTALINLNAGSYIALSGTAIRDNLTGQAALKFNDDASAWFDPVDRCNIHSNISGNVPEFITANYSGNGIQVVLDTFDVLHPNIYYVRPVGDFTFDILHAINPQVSQNLYVALSGSDSNSGLSADDPFRTITMACKTYYPEENARDTIFIAEGSYLLESPEVMPLYLVEGLTLAGAGRDLTLIQGTDSYVASVMIESLSDITLSSLKLSGTPAILMNSGTLHLHYCDIGSGSGTGVLLSGNCELTGDSALITGCGSSGIQIENASAQLNQLQITHNYRGIDVYNSELEAHDLAILHSGSDGLYISNPAGKNVTLRNSLVRFNEKTGINYTSGPEDSSSLSVFNTRISQNSNIGGYGGGLSFNGSTLNLTDCRIEENNAKYGGGIYLQNADTVRISNTTVAMNMANRGGGIYYAATPMVLSWDTVNRSDIYMNQGSEGGHDLYATDPASGYPIIVDTFTVYNPNDRFAYQLQNYSFDILNAYLEQGDVDLYVSPLGSNQNTGTSAEDPLRSLSYACFKMIQDTLPPHRIYLADGIYSPTSTGENFPIDLGGEFEITGTGPENCIIDGEYLARLFIKYNDHDTDYLGGMTLTGGYATGGYGGVINAISGGIIVLENVRLDTNVATRGGALSLNSTDLRLKHVEFTRNKANTAGGAIYAINQRQDFEDVLFYGNRTGANGGALYCRDLDARWKDVIVRENHAYRGGGMYVYYQCQQSAENVLFEGNFARSYGGAIYTSYASGAIENLTLKANQAAQGGGITCYYSSLGLKNLCLTENEASYRGGAIVLYSTSTSMLNLTLSENINLSANGAVICQSYNQDVRLVNSIVHNNYPNEILLSNAGMAVTHCNIEGGQEAFGLSNSNLDWGNGNIDLDPEFLMTGDHPYALSAFSPCIDAGTPDTTGLYLSMWDLMGNYRLWDGDGDGDTIVDIGAYEFGSVGVGLPGQVVQSSKFKVQSYPNPFRDAAMITFDIESAAMISIIVYNSQGIKLEPLALGRFPAGSHRLSWDASGLPSGIYLLKASDGKHWHVMKVIKL